MPNSHKGQNNLLDGTWGPSALTRIYGTSPFQLCHPSFLNKAHQPILVVLFHVIALHALHSGGPPVWAMRPYPKPSNSNSNSAFQGPYLAVKSQRTLGFDPWNFQWLVNRWMEYCKFCQNHSKVNWRGLISPMMLWDVDAVSLRQNSQKPPSFGMFGPGS